MKCPFCTHSSFVLETRMRKDGTIRRQRQCENDKQAHRFATEERIFLPTVGRHPARDFSAMRIAGTTSRGLDLVSRRAAVVAALKDGVAKADICKLTGASKRTVERMARRVQRGSA